MIKVQFLTWNKNYRITTVQSKGNKNYSFYYHELNDSYWVLHDDIHNFLKENNIFYLLEYKADNYFEGDWFVIFERIEDAVLFKLTWG